MVEGPAVDPRVERGREQRAGAIVVSEDGSRVGDAGQPRRDRLRSAAPSAASTMAMASS